MQFSYLETTAVSKEIKAFLFIIFELASDLLFESEGLIPFIIYYRKKSTNKELFQPSAFFSESIGFFILSNNSYAEYNILGQYLLFLAS